MNDNSTAENSGRLYDKPDGRKFLFPAAILSGIFSLATGWIYHISGIHLFPFLTRYVSFLVTYLLICLFIYGGILAYVFHMASGNKKFMNYKVLGLSPEEMIRRTGVKYIDFAGLLLAAILAIGSLILPGMGFLFPAFFFFGIGYLVAIFFGESGKWDLRRRDTHER